MISAYISEQVNLEAYPKIDNRFFVEENQDNEQHHELVFGDLHASALKALYPLIQFNFLELSESDYQSFVKIYNKPSKEAAKNCLNEGDLEEMQRLINAIKINPKVLLRHHKVIFLGDELADRGSNDLFVLMLIHRLHELELDFEILFSNHSAEFLKTYFSGLAPKQNPSHPFYTIITNHQQKQDESLQNLGFLLQRNLVQKTTIDNYMQSYFAHLKVIVASLNHDNTALWLHHHAPASLEILPALLNFLCDKAAFEIDKNVNMITLVNTIQRLIGFTEKNPFTNLTINGMDSAMLYCINAINSGFKDFLQPNKFSQLLRSFKNENAIDLRRKPFQYIIWNRNLKELLRPQNLFGLRVNYIHGHDRDASTFADNVVNLDKDNFIGRMKPDGEFLHQHTYPLFLNTHQFNHPFIQEKIANFDVTEFIQRAETTLSNFEKENALATTPELCDTQELEPSLDSFEEEPYSKRQKRISQANEEDDQHTYHQADLLGSQGHFSSPFEQSSPPIEVGNPFSKQ